MAVELPLDTLAGPTFDGLDVITGPGEFEANAMAFELWSMLLNHGYRVAGTASSDACFDRPGGAIPGAVRTYTYLGDGFSLPAVTRAAAHGANFATSGPLLLVSLDGEQAGSAVEANGKPHTIKIEAWASGCDTQGLSRLELLRNGAAAQTILFSPPISFFQTNITLQSRENCWYCVRVMGGDPQRQRAITGAFFFEREGLRPPEPVMAKVRVTVQDAKTGEKLTGSVTEVSFLGPVPRQGKRHDISMQESMAIPVTVRLQADVAGYRSQIQSPFLDNAPLRNLITGLSAEDLLDWGTFERVGELLSEITLTFNLQKKDQ